MLGGTMAITRINRRNLLQIMGGEVKERHNVIIKFYGQDCHLCHALKPTYTELSQEHDDVKFYAFNMDNGEGLEKKFGFTGVPTICFVNTGPKPTVTFMEEPKRPHEETWYHPTAIRIFIKENKKDA